MKVKSGLVPDVKARDRVKKLMAMYLPDGICCPTVFIGCYPNSDKYLIRLMIVGPGCNLFIGDSYTEAERLATTRFLRKWCRQAAVEIVNYYDSL